MLASMLPPSTMGVADILKRLEKGCQKNINFMLASIMRPSTMARQH